MIFVLYGGNEYDSSQEGNRIKLAKIILPVEPRFAVLQILATNSKPLNVLYFSMRLERYCYIQMRGMVRAPEIYMVLSC